MVMNWIFTGMVGIAVICSLILGRGSELAGAVTQGAQSGVTLAISLAGSLCLWSGVRKVMECVGITNWLSRLLSPLIFRLFPPAKQDKILAGNLSGNICANLLGLGNAATPMGIQAAKRLAGPEGYATNSMCRLIVLNTASIQLIPTTVAAVRSSLGCATPFDILPAVWITSLCSATAGLLAAFLLGRLWRK